MNYPLLPMKLILAVSTRGSDLIANWLAAQVSVVQSESGSNRLVLLPVASAMADTFYSTLPIPSRAVHRDMHHF